jgi:pimeloyl-ACP methyl ester carboxylesterase
MLVQAYAELSPDGPEHLAVVVEKLAPALAVTSVRLPDLARVAAPTLVMAADDDMVSIAPLEAMRDALPDAQVAVVPGTSHALPLEKPDLTARLIRDFLADEQVTKLMPMR